MNGRFLFNCYLPKSDGSTTEVDVILINPNGIFVFESKNYSGWIFGREYDEYWTQILPKQRGESIKTKFYNPIWQNKAHINTLKKIIPNSVPIYSIIVFSNKCEIKELTRTTNEKVAAIVKLYELYNYVNNINMVNRNKLSYLQIVNIYNKLYPYTQVNDKVKQQHINSIKK